MADSIIEVREIAFRYHVGEFQLRIPELRIIQGEKVVINGFSYGLRVIVDEPTAEKN